MNFILKYLLVKAVMVTGKRAADVQRSLKYDRRSIKLYERNNHFMKAMAKIVSQTITAMSTFPGSPVLNFL